MESEETDFSSLTPTEMRELYLHDPDRFDALAAEAIRQACSGKTSEQTLKLRRMQWNIEGQLRKGKTPLQKMQIMGNLFYDQVFSGDGHLNKLMASWSEFARTCETDSVAGSTPRLRLVRRKSSNHVPTA